MGFNLSQIVNKQLSVQEQSAYDFVFVPPRNNNNVVLSNWSIGMYADQMEGFRHITSTTKGGYIHFRFSGRRVGILINKASANGILSFDVDGTHYGQYDTSFVDDYSVASILYNIPIVIATDLPDGEHVLTITKPDNKATSVQGFLVDTAGGAQTFNRSSLSYHDMFDSDNPTWVNAIGTADTTIRAKTSWVMSATFTNTTASPINVTLKSGSGSIIGPFPIPANDIRQLSGPIYFQGSIKAIASAVGVNVTMGVQ